MFTSNVKAGNAHTTTIVSKLNSGAARYDRGFFYTLETDKRIAGNVAKFNNSTKVKIYTKKTFFKDSQHEDRRDLVDVTHLYAITINRKNGKITIRSHKPLTTRLYIETEVTGTESIANPYGFFI